MEFIIGIAFHSEHCEKLCDPCVKEIFSIERYIFCFTLIEHSYLFYISAL
jgi:hypothetical protein